MKIKLINYAYGTHQIGDIVDAIQHPTLFHFESYDANGSRWSYQPGEIEIVAEEQKAESKQTPSMTPSSSN